MNKKFIFFFFLFFLILIVFIKADVPKYSFGSMQETENLVINPGKEISTRIYFYNVYGNRNTHIRLDIKKPRNWEVIINPQKEKVTYDISGELKKFEENLVVEPSNILNSKDKDNDKIKYIKSKEGFIGANFVDVSIRIPEKEELGKQEFVKINVVAFWLNSGGGVAIEQERTFEYKVKVLAEEFYEKKVKKINKEQKDIIPKGITGAVVGTNIKNNYLFGIIIFLIIIIFLLIFLNFRNKK